MRITINNYILLGTMNIFRRYFCEKSCLTKYLNIDIERLRDDYSEPCVKVAHGENKYIGTA